MRRLLVLAGALLLAAGAAPVSHAAGCGATPVEAGTRCPDTADVSEPGPRYGQRVVLAPDGRTAYHVGGTDRSIQLVAHQLDTGRRLWSLASRLPATPAVNTAAVSPDGRLLAAVGYGYGQVGTAVVLVDLARHRVAWHVIEPDDGRDDEAVGVGFAGDRLLVADRLTETASGQHTDWRVRALALSGGRVLWQHEVEHVDGRDQSPEAAAIVGGRFVVVGQEQRDSGGSDEDAVIRWYDVRSGAVVGHVSWDSPSHGDDALRNLAVAGSQAVAVGDDGLAIGIDGSGHRRWVRQLGHLALYGAAVDGAQAFVVGADPNPLAAAALGYTAPEAGVASAVVALDVASGRTRWQRSTSSQRSTWLEDVAAAAGRVVAVGATAPAYDYAYAPLVVGFAYAGTPTAAHVEAFRASDGSRLWTSTGATSPPMRTSSTRSSPRGGAPPRRGSPTRRTTRRTCRTATSTSNGPTRSCWGTARRVGAMEIGFGVPVSGSWAGPAGTREVAQRAEELGYASLWSFQRTLYPVDGSIRVVYRSVQDPLAVAGFLAGVTERVRIGLAVVNVPFYSPLVLAKALTTVDVLSGGRLDVGLGLGWNPDEFVGAGTPMEARGARAEEFLQALRAVWGPDPVSHRGELYQVPESVVLPKPVQEPVPVLLGGTADASVRRAGRLADGWISASTFPAEKMPHAISLLRAAREEAGRPWEGFRVVVRAVVRVRDTDEDRAFSGTLDKVRRDIEAYSSYGVTELFVDLNFDEEIGNPDADAAASLRRAHTALEAFAPA